MGEGDLFRNIFDSHPPHMQEFLIAANIALRFPPEGANDDADLQDTSESHDGEKQLYVKICFHGMSPPFIHLANSFSSTQNYNQERSEDPLCRLSKNKKEKVTAKLSEISHRREPGGRASPRLRFA